MIDINKLCKICYSIAAIISLGVGFLCIFVFGNRTLPIRYDGPITIEDENGSTELSSGQEANFCVHNGSWVRLCESTLVMRLEVGRNNFDYPEHIIPVPEHTGPLPEKKCRPFKVPKLGMGVDGPAKVTGFARSVCWPTDKIWPLITTFPEADFTIKKEAIKPLEK